METKERILSAGENWSMKWSSSIKEIQIYLMIVALCVMWADDTHYSKAQAQAHKQAQQVFILWF